MWHSVLRAIVAAAVLTATGAACSAEHPPAAARKPIPVTTTSPRPAPSPVISHGSAPIDRWVTRRPSWLGKRVLPKRPDGFGVVQATPPILRDRRLATIDFLPPPKSKRFSAHIGPVPRTVVKRSTWRPKCPVGLDQLSYITMTFWGFDHKRHTGEMIVNRSVADIVVGVFRQLYRARFPIEEMRVTSLKAQRAAPTGDINDTSSFECRRVTLGSSWSQHAYGLAIDINPFQNPYVSGDLVAPELAPAYRNRTWRRPGMIFEGDVVTRAFAAAGWGWGGLWTSLKDWMHFSQNGH